MRPQRLHDDPRGAVRRSPRPAMRRRTLLGCLASVATFGAPADAQQRPAFVVALTMPTGGVHDGWSTLVEATVSDPGVRRAWLTANGLTREVPVAEGRVRESILALPGANRVSLMATSAGATARDAVTFYARGVEADLVVWITWPEGAGPVRLEVTDPARERCRLRIHYDDAAREWPYHSCEGEQEMVSRETRARPSPALRAGLRERALRAPSGRPSFVGSPWYGYAIRPVRANRYTIRTALQSYRSDEHHWLGDVALLLAQLDAPGASSTPARRAELLAQLDRAAGPIPTSTPVRVLAVLFPGTSQERRWIFDGAYSPYNPGSIVGELEVTDAMLRAAHGARP